MSDCIGITAPIVIIGSGMAGYTFARELRKLNSNVGITLICQDAGDSYSKPTLSNAFAQGKSADSLAIASSEAMADNLQITVMNFYTVSAIEPKDKTVTIHPVLASDKQQVLAYSELVIATGASPRLLPNVAVDNARIFAINHLDEYKKFQQTIHHLLNNQPSVKVAIIGAGLIGCEFANDLVSKVADHHLSINVFDNANLPLANQLPPQAGQALQTALQNAGVTFELGVSIEHIKKTGDKVTVTVEDNQNKSQTTEFDVVLIAIGLTANTQLAENTGLDVAHLADSLEHDTHLPRTAKQGILVNQFLQSSHSHIYAIGDCANVTGSFMPYVMPLMNQAKALAKTLADPAQPPTAVSYPAMPVAIKTPSLPLVVLPVSAKYSDETIVWETTPTADGMVLSAFSKTDDKTLLGFVLVGKEAGKQRISLSKLVANWL